MTKTKEMFDNQYRKRSPLFGTTPTNVLKKLTQLLSSTANIVELGAGDGRDTLFLLNCGYRVVAVDFSTVGLNRLSAKAEGIGASERLSIQPIDVMEWEPTLGYFDAVVGITILDHLDITGAVLLLDKIKKTVCVNGYVCLEMYSDRDPAFLSEGNDVSEFASVIKFFAPRNWLIDQFKGAWRVIYYSDRLEQDLDHGEPHYHGFSTIIVQRIAEEAKR